MVQTPYIVVGMDRLGAPLQLSARSSTCQHADNATLFDLKLTPPQVEDPKKALLLYGGRTSQVVKDALTDFGKLKGVRLWDPW